jgi:hypothetical protein
VWLCGCSSGRDDFIGARVKDQLQRELAGVHQTASCFIGDESYIEGASGTGEECIVRLEEPSEVKVSFFFDDISAVGTLTSIVWYETGARPAPRRRGRSTVATESNSTASSRGARILSRRTRHHLLQERPSRPPT